MSGQNEQPFDRLKPRELEVLRLIAEGRSNQEIAARLMIEVTTVRWHNRQIYSKLGVHSRTLMIARAREHGLLDVGMLQATPQSPATANALPLHQQNLPAQSSSFIGRQREITLARQLLAASRLLTLTGAGGTGKTVLALEVAHLVSAEYAGGVWFVPLASVTEPRLLAATIAGALKITESTTESVDATLLSHLRDQQILLVIDNFEHLINASSLLPTLLAAAPLLKAIVTSREVLRLSGEQEYPVPPLTMPEAEMAYSSQELMNFEAVQLFLTRAQASRPTFQWTSANLQAVAEICARLDGLPLAIELAAARSKVLGPQQLLARLASGVGTLGQGPRDAPARQRTLVATLDWSYNLLTWEEKQLLSRLSVFQGGWTVDAMEAICGNPIDADSLDALFDGLHSLIDKSLVQTANDDHGVGGDFGREPRFKMLATVREYVRARLPQDEAAVLQRRHCDIFLKLAERGEKGLETEEAQVWYERLRVEEDNLYAALDWCRQQPQEAEVGLRLAGALCHYWHVRGISREGRAWLALFLDSADRRPTFERARALNGAGMLAYRQGEYDEVARLCGEALAISQSLGDQTSAAFALHYLAHVAQERSNYVEAEEMLGRALSLYDEEGNRWGYAEVLNCLGDLQREVGNYAEAATLLEESLMLRRTLKDRRGMAVTLCNLGHVLCRLPDTLRAAACFRDGLDIAQALNNKLMSVICILGFAEIAALQNDPQRSVHLLGATTALLDSFGYKLEPSDRADYDWLMAQMHGQLDDESFDAAWVEGAQMSLAQAVAYT